MFNKEGKSLKNISEGKKIKVRCDAELMGICEQFCKVFFCWGVCGKKKRSVLVEL